MVAEKEVECAEAVEELSRAIGALGLAEEYARTPRIAARIASETFSLIKSAKEKTLLTDEEYERAMGSVARAIYNLVKLGRVRDAKLELSKAIEALQEAISRNLEECLSGVEIKGEIKLEIPELKILI